MAAKSLSGHMPLWIDSLCCLTFGPVKLLSWKKNARYRSFAWFENSDLQSSGCLRLPFSSIYHCKCTWVLGLVTIGGGTGSRCIGILLLAELRPEGWSYCKLCPKDAI